MVNKRERIYKNDVWHKRYKNRCNRYISAFEDILGEHYKSQFDEIQVEEMVRCELELEDLDRKIGNEDLEFAPQDLLMQRRECRKALFQYRNNLLLSMEKRVRNKVGMSKKRTTEEMLTEIAAHVNLEDFTV